jgi:hypothetical protein
MKLKKKQRRSQQQRKKWRMILTLPPMKFQKEIKAYVMIQTKNGESVTKNVHQLVKIPKGPGRNARQRANKIAIALVH